MTLGLNLWLYPPLQLLRRIDRHTDIVYACFSDKNKAGVRLWLSCPLRPPSHTTNTLHRSRLPSGTLPT